MATSNPFASPAADDDTSEYYSLQLQRARYRELWNCCQRRVIIFLIVAGLLLVRRSLRAVYGLALWRMTFVDPADPPDWARDALAGPASEVESLGYQRRLASYFPVVGLVKMWTLTCVEPAGLRRCNLTCQRIGKKTVVRASFQSTFASGAVLMTGDWIYPFDLPDGYRFDYHRKATLAQLQQFHREAIERQPDDPPVTFSGVALVEHLRAQERVECEYFVSRGLYRPLPQHEVNRLRAVGEQ